MLTLAASMNLMNRLNSFFFSKFELASPVVSEEDFLGLWFVQSWVVLCYICRSRRSYADFGGRDDLSTCHPRIWWMCWCWVVWYSDHLLRQYKRLVQWPSPVCYLLWCSLYKSEWCGDLIIILHHLHLNEEKWDMACMLSLNQDGVLCSCTLPPSHYHLHSTKC